MNIEGCYRVNAYFCPPYHTYTKTLKLKLSFKCWRPLHSIWLTFFPWNGKIAKNGIILKKNQFQKMRFFLVHKPQYGYYLHLCGIEPWQWVPFPKIDVSETLSGTTNVVNYNDIDHSSNTFLGACAHDNILRWYSN